MEQRIDSILQNLRNILKKKGTSKLSAISAANGLTLFDIVIAACHCDQFDDCACPRQLKVPVLEREFLKDQRSARKMFIGSVDKSVTSAFLNRRERESFKTFEILCTS